MCQNGRTESFSETREMKRHAKMAYYLNRLFVWGLSEIFLSIIRQDTATGRSRRVSAGLLHGWRACRMSQPVPRSRFTLPLATDPSLLAIEPIAINIGRVTPKYLCGAV